jgi:ketosteroid isomerase-like protein
LNLPVNDDRRELVLRLVDAVNRRDVDAITAELDADFELRPLVSVWERSYRGHSGVEAWLRDVAGLWERFEIEADEVRDPGGRSLVLVGRWRGTPRGSSAPLDGPISVVVRFAGARVSRAEIYLDPAEATEAASGG